MKERKSYSRQSGKFAFKTFKLVLIKQENSFSSLKKKFSFWEVDGTEKEEKGDIVLSVIYYCVTKLPQT